MQHVNGRESVKQPSRYFSKGEGSVSAAGLNDYPLMYFKGEYVFASFFPFFLYNVVVRGVDVLERASGAFSGVLMLEFSVCAQ